MSSEACKLSVTPPPPPPPPRGCELLCENIFEDIDGASTDGSDDELLKRREPTMQRRGKKLLAPQSQEEKSLKRYTVVLDLDETVVYARDGPLYARAYLRDLLGTLRDNRNSFEVIVWTAGDREYAKNVLAEINADHVFDHLIYRHRKWFNEEDYTKDLSQLGRDLNYTIIVENTPDCVRQNPANGVIVEDFEVPPPESAEAATDTTESAADATLSQPSSNLPTSSPSSNQDDEATSKDGAADAEALTSQATPQRPKRVATDRTLLLLRELLVALAASGETVPVFLAHCELLSRQTVVASDGAEIPIYYLGTRRRRKDAGSVRKAVKANRDRVLAAPAAPGDGEKAVEEDSSSALASSPPPVAAPGQPAARGCTNAADDDSDMEDIKRGRKTKRSECGDEPPAKATKKDPADSTTAT